MKVGFIVLGKFVDKVEKLLYLGGSWSSVFLMLLVVADVGYRIFTSRSIPGQYELSELIMAGMVSCTLAYTQNLRGHIRMELLIDRLTGKTSRLVEAVALSITLAICIIITYQSALEAAVAVDMPLFTMGIVQWPVWPLKIGVSVGFFLVCLRIVIQIIQLIRSPMTETMTRTP